MTKIVHDPYWRVYKIAFNQWAIVSGPGAFVDEGLLTVAIDGKFYAPIFTSRDEAEVAAKRYNLEET